MPACSRVEVMPWSVETTEQRAKAPRSCNEDT